MSNNKYPIPITDNNIQNQLLNLSNNTIKNSMDNINYLLLDISQNIIYDVSNCKYLYNENTINYITVCFRHVPLIPNVDGKYLYLFLTDLKHPTNNMSIIKIGYTKNIIERKSELEYYFKNTIYLLAFRTNIDEDQEKEYHKYLKKTYKYLYFPVTINNKNNIETSKFFLKKNFDIEFRK
jgi:hypothetical protein